MKLEDTRVRKDSGEIRERKSCEIQRGITEEAILEILSSGSRKTRKPAVIQVGSKEAAATLFMEVFRKCIYFLALERGEYL